MESARGGGVLYARIRSRAASDLAQHCNCHHRIQPAKPVLEAVTHQSLSAFSLSYSRALYSAASASRSCTSATSRFCRSSTSVRAATAVAEVEREPPATVLARLCAV